MRYGYLKRRRSVDTDKQISMMEEFQIDELFIDSFHSVRELNVLMNKLTTGDSLIVSDLSVFDQGYKHLSEVVRTLSVLGIQLISIQEQIDTTEEEYSKFYYIVDSLINSQSINHSELVMNKIQENIENGEPHGRPPIDHQTIEKIVELRKEKRMSYREIANFCNVSLGTVHKYVNAN